ncbi:hypothetical protein H310_08206 [Aphanomyces invadans]|uniref:Uncharacterized protein n=1 Tax=Aphanomyces invadans TaxID=157072 RepID=A0A024TZW2_9STRA|nr:hypothetical protein H310_08206 [Aphanomyces invadans]ETV99543.1 hypothetical protein H310_08206 [Aphanomyces invadans]|eukprot:XP_008872099.1 hypothetical protein H310_08206 [Aphanomyces invadans]
MVWTLPRTCTRISTSAPSPPPPTYASGIVELHLDFMPQAHCAIESSGTSLPPPTCLCARNVSTMDLHVTPVAIHSRPAVPLRRGVATRPLRTCKRGVRRRR